MPQPLTAAVRYLSGEREPVRVATTSSLSLQGLATVDDVELEVSDRVLVKDQTDQSQNGIYLASEGKWYRAPDASYTRAINQGVTVHVQEGSVNHDRTYRFDSQDPHVGIDPIVITYWLSDSIAADLEIIVNGAAQKAKDLAEEAVGPIIANASTLFAAQTQSLRDEARQSADESAASATEAEMYALMVGAAVYDFNFDTAPSLNDDWNN